MEDVRKLKFTNWKETSKGRRTGKYLAEKTKTHKGLQCQMKKNKIIIIIYLFIYLFTAIGLLPGGSGYFTCKQNMKLVTTRFKLGGLHEKHVVATWNVGNRLSICLQAQGNREKAVSRWPVAGPTEYRIYCTNANMLFCMGVKLGLSH